MSSTDTSSITTTATATTLSASSTDTGSFPVISESVAFISTDESSSIESSATTVSLSPSSSSPNNDYDFTVLCRKVTSKLTAITNHNKKRRVTFALHRNVTRRIEPFADSWLTKAELRAIRCGGLCDIESNKLYFQGYLQSVDAATIHIKYSKEFHPKGQRCREKPDDSDNQKALVDTLTNILVTGCNYGFRGLEHGSKDAHHRRTGRNLAASAIIAKHRLLYSIARSQKSLASKESQFLKFCEGLSYNSRIWAHYIAMVDAAAAMQEYTTIPLSLLYYKNMTPTVPNIVVVPVTQKHSITIMRRMLPTIQLRHSDQCDRRGYQRLEPHDNGGSFPLDDEPVAYTDRPRHSSRSKKTKTIFRKAIQRLKTSIDELKVAASTNQNSHCD